MRLASLVKNRIANPILRKFNVKVARGDGFPRDWADFFKYVKSRGFNPPVVIDVGVASDTNELYREFPRAKMLLVEPLVEFKDSLEALTRKYDAEYVLAAAGATEGLLEISVTADLAGSSSFKSIEAVQGLYDMASRKVPMVTLDRLWKERNLSGPVLLKLDVQGSELEVLKGASDVLKETELVVMETMLINQYVGAPIFHDYVTFMMERGFVVFEIMTGVYTPAADILAVVDLAFVKEHSALRKEQRWFRDDQIAQRPKDYKGVKRKEA